MSENEDLELQALQRHLDDAFQTTRPRAGFDDELWSRMQARRPVAHRLQSFVTGLVRAVREVPKVPAATVAVVLVLAIGVGVISLGGFHIGGGGGATSSTAMRNESGGTQPYGPPGAFGRIPVPTATSELPKASSPGPFASTAPGGAPDTYIGPIKMVWAGQVNIHVSSAPVYRYAEPSTADADQFASSLQARPQGGQSGVGILGIYFGDTFTLEVIGSSTAPIREPFYAILLSPSKLPPAGPTLTETANAFLAAHSLTPTWPFLVAVDESSPPGSTRMIYMRQFAVTAYGIAYLVDAFGQRYGLEVDLRGGQPYQASGPLPLKLDQADYPIITGDQAVRSALALSPTARPSTPPATTVRLTNVELVYALALGGDHSFYEPAYLFSGTFTRNGITYVKRVLVPAIDPSQRLP